MKSIEELVKENQLNTLLGCIKQSKDEYSKSKKDTCTKDSNKL